MEKQCTKCNEVKSLASFQRLLNVELGKLVHKAECRTCCLSEKEQMIKDRKKKCNGCEEIKSYNEFYKKGTHKGRVRYSNHCKVCHKTEEKKKYQANQTMKWRTNHPEKARESDRNYRRNHPEKVRAVHKKWCEVNKDKRRESDRKRNLTDNRKDWSRNRHKERMMTDTVYAASQKVRGCILSSTTRRGYTKNCKTFKILGIDYNGFVNHIESLFIEGMTWENRSEWHIDHIVPISFAKTEEEVIKLNHYSNLRPLWAEHNIARGNDINAFIDHCEYSMRIVEEYKQAS
jgi:hypothetical protein